MGIRRNEVLAPAKINLSFGVGNKRADGYHLTYSVMQAICLMDKVTIEISESDFGVSIFSDDENMPKDETNLAVRAARLMLNDGISIAIEKNIPMAAGLAGGSADAAAVVLSLARGRSLDELIEVGIKLGADVPFCIAAAAKANPGLGFADDRLAQGALRAEGIGEKLSPMPLALPKATVVLIKPPISVSTPFIFGLLDEETTWTPRTGFVPYFTNDLELVTPKAFPVVREILTWLRTSYREGSFMMSGSGPTCFAYIKHDAKDPARAKDYAAKICEEAKKEFPLFQVIQTETL